jgi:hypothetical protein
MESTDSRQRAATLGEIRATVGELQGAKLGAILATGVTSAELEEALAWAEGESDVVGELERLPRHFRLLETEPAYPVEIAPALRALAAAVDRRESARH